MNGAVHNPTPQADFVEFNGQVYSRARIAFIGKFYKAALEQPNPDSAWEKAYRILLTKGLTHEEIHGWEQMVMARSDDMDKPTPFVTIARPSPLKQLAHRAEAPNPISAPERSTPQAPPPHTTPSQRQAPSVVPFPSATTTQKPPALRLGDDVKRTQELPFDPEIVGQKIVSVLARLSGVKVRLEYLGFQDSPRVVELRFRQSFNPDSNEELVAPQKIMGAVPALRVYAGLAENAKPVIRDRSGYIGVEIQKPQDYWHNCFINEPGALPEVREASKPTDPLKILWGRSMGNEIISTNLSDRATPHFLIGGVTGSGKTGAQDTAIFSLMLQHSPRYLQMVLIDPERISFEKFNRSPWMWGDRSVISDAKEAAEVVKELLESEKSKRQSLFLKAGVESITEYNALPNIDPLPRILVMFDEYFQTKILMPNPNGFEVDMVRFGNEMAKYGGHLGIGTQRTDAQHTLSPGLRDCFKLRVALMTADGAASEKILGEGYKMAASLYGAGDAFIKTPNRLTRIQVFWSAPDLIKRTMKTARSPEWAELFPRAQRGFRVGGKVVKLGG